MSENMMIYDAVCITPQEALRKIQGGRLKGKSDINPFHRYKKLTELFGPCGIGWKFEITSQRLERGTNDVIAAFVDILLYIKHDGKWSDPIPGVGGNSFVSKEQGSMYTNDECFKMALTDALSVACKPLGMCADVYWETDRSKYESLQQPNEAQTTPPPPRGYICVDCGEKITAFYQNGKVIKTDKEVHDGTKSTYGRPLCAKCAQKLAKAT